MLILLLMDRLVAVINREKNIKIKQNKNKKRNRRERKWSHKSDQVKCIPSSGTSAYF